MIHSGKQLDYTYRYEPHVNVRERILLLRRVRIDNQEAASVAELERKYLLSTTMGMLKSSVLRKVVFSAGFISL
ncbi:MAG TPA: hypothetical protein VEL11_14635 [Candidatus Bathyarchaeia archaeon]|nr:hypothetical protein [Candidatus Bathyarchaeia archaeon]